MRKMITSRSVKEDIENLGVGKGDIVFIAADLGRVGYFEENRKTTLNNWMSILIEVIGESGTIVIPAHTKFFYSFSKDDDCIFGLDSPSTSGALSGAFQHFPGVVRSCHPTNSCFAIGPKAQEIIKNHDELSSSYLPFIRVAELGGKNLMIGSFTDKRLAPMAMHCAQESLGLTKKTWSAGLIQSYYMDKEGKKKIFTRNDVGGCSSGGYKAYGHHVIASAIHFGPVGNALSACIDAKESYKIFLEIYKNNAKFLRCDNKDCADCYGSPIRSHPFFWIKFIFKYLKRKVYKKFLSF